ncbi:hypothetical protein F4780DRAFT_660706 [Xylariomycetidae sp. FL0641]|nr:hypothetical protein F4780DRAFT_660706 [Xylariomycetidae sp. FL0641]
MDQLHVVWSPTRPLLLSVCLTATLHLRGFWYLVPVEDSAKTMRSPHRSKFLACLCYFNYRGLSPRGCRWNGRSSAGTYVRHTLGNAVFQGSGSKVS